MKIRAKVISMGRHGVHPTICGFVFTHGEEYEELTRVVRANRDAQRGGNRRETLAVTPGLLDELREGVATFRKRTKDKKPWVEFQVTEEQPAEFSDDELPIPEVEQDATPAETPDAPPA